MPLAGWRVCKKWPQLSAQVIFGLVWMAITLAPTSSFVPIYDAMAERRMYLPGFGFCFLIMTAYLSFSQRASRIVKILLLFFLAAHISILSSATWRRSQKFNSPALLWAESAALYPDNYRANVNLGNIYMSSDDSKALEMYSKAVSLNPALEQPYNNMGLIYLRQNEYAKGYDALRRAIELNPRYTDAYFNWPVCIMRGKNTTVRYSAT